MGRWERPKSRLRVQYRFHQCVRTTHSVRRGPAHKVCRTQRLLKPLSVECPRKVHGYLGFRPTLGQHQSTRRSRTCRACVRTRQAICCFARTRQVTQRCEQTRQVSQCFGPTRRLSHLSHQHNVWRDPQGGRLLAPKPQQPFFVLHQSLLRLLRCL